MLGHCSGVSPLSASSRLTQKQTSNAQGENSAAETPIEIHFLMGFMVRPVLLIFCSNPGGVGHRSYLSTEGREAKRSGT